jgi:hypothetical protein
MTRKNGRSAGFALALTGKSAALAKPAGMRLESDSAAAANVLRRLDILNTPKLTIDDQGPWRRPLRRSLELRSLNFFHGMPQVSSRSRCAAAISAKMGGAGRRAKQPRVATEISTYADFYWVSATIGRSASDPASAKTALVHRANNSAQLRVRRDLPISNCLDRHNFATGYSAFSPLPFRKNTERQRQGSIKRQQASPESPGAIVCQRVEQGLALFPHLRRRPN